MQNRTPEEIKKFNAEKTRRGNETKLRNQGIDPATHVTKAERLKQRSEWWASLSPEEKARVRSETARKAQETRRRRKAGEQ